MTSPEQLEQRYKTLGVDCSMPGFYDQPAFLRKEQTDASFLYTYADYVQSRHYAPEYLHRARETVKAATDFLFGRLVEDGRKGACIDASLVLSRFLEKEAIWNYVVTGSLAIKFDGSTGLEPTYFWHMRGPWDASKAGHTWVYAPPFRVVDLTLALQPFQGGEDRYLTGYVAAETSGQGKVVIDELVESRWREKFRLDHGRPLRLADIDTMRPGLRDRIKRYGVSEVRMGEATLKYVPCDPTACDGALEKMYNLCLSGRYPSDMYADFVSERRAT